jgi:hypothetical protein
MRSDRQICDGLRSCTTFLGRMSAPQGGRLGWAIVGHGEKYLRGPFSDRSTTHRDRVGPMRIALISDVHGNMA